MKKLLLICTFICCFFFINKAQNFQNSTTYGITLCGAEFGENNLPGILNRNYTYPNLSEINYFAAKGAKLIQLPFKWERIQRSLGGELDEQELNFIKKFVDDCAKKNIQVTLVMQNFGRYKIDGIEYVIGSTTVPFAAYADVWKRIANAMKNKSNVYAFSIMSEPHDMGYNKWFMAAQQVINSIRLVDNKTTILVDGDNYSGPETWVKYNDNLKYLRDPTNNLMFNAHCYFDEDRSGHYVKNYNQSGANENTGVERIKPFIEWCKTNNKKPFVGEFGVPKNDARWLAVLENFLSYLADNEVSGCYWAAGPWWKNYPLSIEPVSNQDQPQMFVYAKYLNTNRNNTSSNFTLQKAKSTVAAK
jgi:endoglucanase